MGKSCKNFIIIHPTILGLIQNTDYSKKVKSLLLKMHLLRQIKGTILALPQIFLVDEVYNEHTR